ncbi:unnamed protein product [Moneuplotes crassus]|uniref:Uncharacterized protein n=1 Tax=Euplotes crassus TaxID=5936 RepID=A0AAD1XPJ7_EUPCR|nr:unnamed protein product [Moneuplotes crassus]
MKKYLKGHNSLRKRHIVELPLLKEELKINQEFLHKFPKKAISYYSERSNNEGNSFSLSTENKFFSPLKKLKNFKSKIETLEIVCLTEQLPTQFLKFLLQSRIGSAGIEHLKIGCPTPSKENIDPRCDASRILKHLGPRVSTIITISGSDISPGTMQKLMISIPSVKRLNFINCKIDVEGAKIPARATFSLQELVFIKCHGKQRSDWDSDSYKFEDFLSFISKSSIKDRYLSLKVFSNISDSEMREMLRNTGLSDRVKLEGAYMKVKEYY